MGLQASADLPVLLQDAHFKSLLHQQVAADKSSHATPYYYHVIILHNQFTCSCFNIKKTLDVYFVLSMISHFMPLSLAMPSINVPEIKDSPFPEVLLNPTTFVEKNSVSFVPLCFATRSLFPSLMRIVPPGRR